MKLRFPVLLFSFCLLTACAVDVKNNEPVGDFVSKVDTYAQSDHRSEKNISRNQYRHPKETLAFFGLEENMTLVEIWPSTGWYTEILAPLLKEKGKYYAAGFATSANRTPQWRKNLVQRFDNKLKARPELYSEVIVTELSIPERTEIAPENSADMVLTFRNVHNWMKGEYAPGVFETMYKALKPGGILGVVEHRAKQGTSLEQQIKSGYVTEAHVKQLAQEAGFEFLESSEVNANPKDSADHPKGVWTLPPSLRLGEQDKEKYLAIGESDRMTLKFIKPAK
jgi:predicted methyltransferase